MNTTLPTHPKDFLKKASMAARHYGFVSLDEAIGTKKPKEKRKGPMQIGGDDTFSNEVADVIRKCAEKNATKFTHPLFISHLSDPSISKRKKKDDSTIGFTLIALGVQSSIAEALVLKTATAILNDIDIAEHCTYVNSMGDKDSVLKFTREFNIHLRKQINELPAQGRQILKKDIYQVLPSIQGRSHSVYDDMPKPMEFLSDKSRTHLKEVLEYLETTEIPYEIDNQMIGHKNSYRETLFEIRSVKNGDGAEEVTLASGGRCDEVARRMYRLQIPAVGITFLCKRDGLSKNPKIPKKRVRQTKCYFIQFGSDAKRQSLSVIELLRNAGLSVHQHLHEATLAEQIRLAKEYGAKYSIIMGQKEALESAAIVRNMDSQAQKIVSLEELPSYLKTILL